MTCVFKLDDLKSLQNYKLHSADLEVWSKLAERTRIKHSASKWARDFDCNWERVNAFSHCVTLRHVLLLQIISYSDTKVPVLVVMEYKRAIVLYTYEMIFLLHTSRLTGYKLTWCRTDWVIVCFTGVRNTKNIQVQSPSWRTDGT